MKSRLTMMTSLVFVLLMVTTTMVSASGREYETRLSGRFEAPVRVTKAKGEAEFERKDNGRRLHYKLKVEKITNVWMAHIHMAAAGTNGPNFAPWLRAHNPLS